MGSPYSFSSMQYSPPQNLTAEAVAALPPPGKSITSIMALASFRSLQILIFCFRFLLRPLWSIINRVQPQIHILPL
jgi:hypothetical protein